MGLWAFSRAHEYNNDINMCSWYSTGKQELQHSHIDFCSELQTKLEICTYIVCMLATHQPTTLAHFLRAGRKILGTKLATLIKVSH